MHHFSPFSAVIGGAMIGLAATLFLLAHGRSCGISGLFAGLLRRSAAARDVRFAFVGGLLGGGVLLNQFYPSAFERAASPPLLLAISAGLLVGFGTQLGNGCTSGHGICGISRLSLRSFVATGTFLSTGIATRFVVHHVFGGW